MGIQYLDSMNSGTYLFGLDTQLCSCNYKVINDSSETDYVLKITALDKPIVYGYNPKYGLAVINPENMHIDSAFSPLEDILSLSLTNNMKSVEQVKHYFETYGSLFPINSKEPLEVKYSTICKVINRIKYIYKLLNYTMQKDNTPTNEIYRIVMELNTYDQISIPYNGKTIFTSCFHQFAKYVVGHEDLKNINSNSNDPVQNTDDNNYYLDENNNRYYFDPDTFKKVIVPDKSEIYDTYYKTKGEIPSCNIKDNIITIKFREMLKMDLKAHNYKGSIIYDIVKDDLPDELKDNNGDINAFLESFIDVIPSRMFIELDHYKKFEKYLERYYAGTGELKVFKSMHKPPMIYKGLYNKSLSWEDCDTKYERFIFLFINVPVWNKNLRYFIDFFDHTAPFNERGHETDYDNAFDLILNAALRLDIEKDPFDDRKKFLFNITAKNTIIDEINYYLSFIKLKTDFKNNEVIPNIKSLFTALCFSAYYHKKREQTIRKCKCYDCENVFPVTKQNMKQIYCSTKCKNRDAKRAERARKYEENNKNN